MKLTPIFTGLLALALMMPGVANADITIDDYSAGNTLTQFGAGSPLPQTTIDGSILGGQREDTVTVTNQGGAEGFGLMGFGSSMNVAQGVGDRINGGVTYNNFGTMDLTQGGANDRFTVNLLSSDIDAATGGVLSITTMSTSGNSTQSVTIPASSGLPANVNTNFADFAGVDFSEVTSISLDFDFANEPGRDFSIGSFSATTSAVPEPGSLTLLAGLAMVGVARRRRR